MIDLMAKFRSVLLVIGFALLAVSTMHGQTNYGAVRGLAKDVQGAVIPNATVTLTNTGTKIERAAKTNDSGEYLFTAVDPGDYVVTITLSGFKSYKQTIIVDLGLTATIDATLQVGATGETVEVSTTGALIDTASANGGQLFNEQQLQELPNLGRNPFVFEKLDTNVTPVGDPRYVRAEDQSGSSAISVAGAPIGSNNYIVDGIPTSTSAGGVTFIPSVEAVSDAKVQANTYDAEVGRTGGGAFNTSMKSGTSSYHGVLYGMTRQTDWSANSWANKHTPLTLNGVTTPTTARGDATTYLYAGAFGGPVPFSNKIKYLKNTFFWVTEEGYRQAQPLTGSGSLIVPTAAEAAGDFSADPITLYDPTSPFALGASGCAPTVLCRTRRLANNIIPASLMNPIGKWVVQNAYPGATLTAAYGQPNSQRVSSFKTRSDEFSGKLDHVFAPWWSGAASYVHLATQEPSGDFYGDRGYFSSDAKLVRFNDATAVSSVFTINPTTLVTVGYGFNRYYSVSFRYSTGFNSGNGFGGAGFATSFASQAQSKTFPTFTTSLGSTSGASLGGSNSGRSIPAASHNFVVGLVKTVGKQNMKMGYVYRAMHVASDPTGTAGTFAFNGNYTSVDGKVTGGSTGNGFADLFLGAPATAALTVAAGSFNEVASYHALYFQDDFRVTDKFTVNLGVRYEYELGQRELKNQMTVGFDPSITYAFPSAAGPVAHGGLVYAGKNGYPTHTGDNSKAKFSPRIGLAYQLRKGTVIRGGFGVFYAPLGVSAYNAGYSQDSSYASGNITTPLATAQTGAGAYLSNPFSGGSNGVIVQPSQNTLGIYTSLGSTVSVIDFKRRFPFVEQYSMDIQHELGWQTTLKVAYSGAHAQNFPLAVNINQLPNSQFAALAANPSDQSANAPGTNPYFAATVSNGTTAYATGAITNKSTIPLGQLLLPFPQFSTVTLSKSVGYSLYNALSVKVQKRATKGLTVVFGYTWASNWDNLYSGGSTLNGTNGPADNYNLKKEYARAVNDIPNRFTLGLTYKVPVGRGQRFFGNMPRVLDLLLGGYDVNSVTSRQDGGPLGITQGTNFSTQYGVTGFGGTVRPNFVAGVDPCYSGKASDRTGQPGQTRYFNTAAFTGTPAFTYGNVTRTIPCKGPGLSNTDLSINKTFSFGEKVKIQLRAEALNVTNTTQFGLSSTALPVSQATVKTAAGPVTPTALTSTSTFGQLSQINYSRLIQLGGRISF